MITYTQRERSKENLWIRGESLNEPSSNLTSTGRIREHGDESNVINPYLLIVCLQQTLSSALCTSICADVVSSANSDPRYVHCGAQITPMCPWYLCNFIALNANAEMSRCPPPSRLQLYAAQKMTNSLDTSSLHNSQLSTE